MSGREKGVKEKDKVTPTHTPPLPPCTLVEQHWRMSQFCGRLLNLIPEQVRERVTLFDAE